MNPVEGVLRFFEYTHLPHKLQNVSQPYHDLAHNLEQAIEHSPELTVALRKLLESKDAAVRAKLIESE